MADVTSQLRRTSVSWYVALPEAFADWREPTVAEMNDGDYVMEITCAVDEDATTFSLGDSDTNDRYSYCDESGIDRPTFYNPEVTLGIYRDADRTASGEFNTALELFMKPDIRLFVIKRVGDQDNGPGVLVAAGDRLKIQDIKTDLPADTLAADDPVMISASGLQMGRVAWNIEVAA